MKQKQIITAVLLLFIAVSLIAVVVKERGSSTSAVNKTGLLQGDKTIVYFFHGNKRCKTCNNMERYTRLALDENLAKELEDGSVDLKLVNLDETGNGHYVDDYEMDVRVVVLSKIVDGKEVKRKKMEKVWELSGDEDAFKKYIVAGVTDMMKDQS